MSSRRSDAQLAADIAFLDSVNPQLVGPRDERGIPTARSRDDVHFLADLARCWKQVIEGVPG